MDPIGTVSEGEWSCLSGTYTGEEADFMEQLLGNCPLGSSSNMGASSGFCWPSGDRGMDIELGSNGGSFYDSHEMVGAKFYHFSQGSSSSYSGDSSNLFQSSCSCDEDRHYIANKRCPVLVTTDHSPISVEYHVGDASNTATYLVECDDSSIQENVEETNGDRPDQDQAELESQVSSGPENDHDHHLQPKIKLKNLAEEPVVKDKSNDNNGDGSPPLCTKKRSRSGSSGDNARSDQRIGRGSKNQKVASSSGKMNEEENSVGLSLPDSSTCCSEDDSNGSHEHNGGVTYTLCSKGTHQALNLNGKTRAGGRGAATDPQSLYARKRREKINERLKILQSLVPNGTKVDISTMLEEAVQYVKFLQLQIKLLSSDNLWMYAPIAYNGMDIGLDLKIPNSM